MNHERHDATTNVSNPSRRNFLKLGGVTAVAASVAGAVGAGFQLGRDPDSYVGWGRTEEGKDMFFDRESFRVDYPPTFRKVGTIERPEWASHLFNRTGCFRKAFTDGWTPDMGLSTFPDKRIRDYYKDMPDRFEEMLRAFRENEKRKANVERLRDQFAIGWLMTAPMKKPHTVPMTTQSSSPSARKALRKWLTITSSILPANDWISNRHATPQSW